MSPRNPRMATLVSLGLLLCAAADPAAARKKPPRSKKAAKAPVAAPVEAAAEVAPPEPAIDNRGAARFAIDPDRVTIGAPLAGAGRLAVLHLAAGLRAQPVDVYAKAAAPAGGFDPIGVGVPYGSAAVADRPPGGVSALSLAAGARLPGSPGLFSGPTLVAGGVVHVAVVGGPREGGYLHGHLTSVSGEFPEGASRIGWVEVRGREGQFEVCADSGGGLTKWFHYEVSATTWPISGAFTGKGWETFRNVPPGKVTIELRQRDAAECAGRLLGQGTLELPGGAVKLIHYGAESGAGHLLACPQGPPFDCIHRAL